MSNAQNKIIAQKKTSEAEAFNEMGALYPKSSGFSEANRKCILLSTAQNKIIAQKKTSEAEVFNEMGALLLK